MSDTNLPNEEVPAGAGSTSVAPAPSVDVTALEEQIRLLQQQNQDAQAQLETFRKENENLQKARGGAQASAADAKERAGQFENELRTATERMQKLQADLQAQAQQSEEAIRLTNELKTQLDTERKRARVLELTGVKSPALVPLVAEGIVNVSGDDDEAIKASVDAALKRLTNWGGAPTSEEAAPVTPPVVPSWFRPVPMAATANQGEIQSLKRQAAEEAMKAVPDQTVMDRIQQQIKDLQGA